MELDEYFREIRTATHQRRLTMRAAASEKLTREGINYVSQNAGAHLIVVSAGGAIFDFWPGTRRWASRAKPVTSGRGTSHLIKHLKGLAP